MFRALESLFLDRFQRRYSRLAGARKSHLFADLRGNVLEVGAGSGANFDFLPPNLHWTGIDPNPHGLRYVRAAALRSGHKFDFRVARAEALPFPDGSFDAALSTLALCSIPDPVRALAELRRVLRPGGRLLFMEHVAAPQGSSTLKRQRLVRPLFRCVAGCTPDLPTGQLLGAAGFAELRIEEFTLDLPIVGPHICGCAVR